MCAELPQKTGLVGDRSPAAVIKHFKYFVVGPNRSCFIRNIMRKNNNSIESITKPVQKSR